MICFSYFCQKKCFPFWAWPIKTPFCANWVPKTIFFRTAGLHHKLLILIESCNIFHLKSAKKSKVGVVFGAKFGPNLFCCEKTKKLVFWWVFFDILLEVYIYKHDIVLKEIPEWKLKAKLARNTIFEGN